LKNKHKMSYSFDSRLLQVLSPLLILISLILRNKTAVRSIMSKKFFFRLVWLTMPLFFNSAKSQNDPFAYAVTSINKGGSEWIALRKLDTRTGEFGNILLNLQGNIQQSIKIPPAIGDAVSNPFPQSAMGNSVAALAYDSRSNRLYYTAMSIDQLRYIDLITLENHIVSDQFFSKAGNYDARNSGPINRLVIAPDGYGYTITNDGTHLIRFNTKGTTILSDLGDLVDDPMNKEMTIHSICANSGGDMIADDAGHLYLITGTNKVFKVDISTRVATYITKVSGLPQKFTTSGAAVGENGSQIIVTSSIYSEEYFLIDAKTWIASPAQNTREIYETADLANSNVLFTKSNTDFIIGKNPESLNGIRIFPNPILDNSVSIQFTNLPPGKYKIQLANTLGIKLKEQLATVTGAIHTEMMHIPRYASEGFYLIHILDEKNNIVSTQKLVVEHW